MWLTNINQVTVGFKGRRGQGDNIKFAEQSY